MHRSTGGGSLLLHFDVGRPDDLAPLFSFPSNQHAEVSRRTYERGPAEVDEARVDLGIAETGIDFLVELVNDLDGRVLGRADAVKGACLVAWHEIANGRQVRQRFRARSGGHRQRA